MTGSLVQLLITMYNGALGGEGGFMNKNLKARRFLFVFFF